MYRELLYTAIGFATCAHRKQLRKYTGEPYVNHCRNVATTVENFINSEAAVVAALLHDTVEDTDVTPEEIEAVFGAHVRKLVMEVTDASKPQDGNRERRKQIDREHLAKSSPEGATIKLADLIDNTSSIVRYDKNFAQKYLEEKALLLPLLRHGDPNLWNMAYKTLQEAQGSLVQHSLEMRNAHS
jgi:(p)ppGpp synthase/HD superfamily hydrolase